jgi:hypothetical protein
MLKWDDRGCIDMTCKQWCMGIVELLVLGYFTVYLVKLSVALSCVEAG